MPWRPQPYLNDGAPGSIWLPEPQPELAPFYAAACRLASTIAAPFVALGLCWSLFGGS